MTEREATEPIEPETLQHLERLFELALAIQREGLARVQTRASIAVPGAAVVLTTLLDSSWPHRHLVTALSLASALFALLAMLPRSFRIDPDPSGLVEEYLHKSVADIRLHSLGNYREAFEANRKALRTVKILATLAFVSLFLALVVPTCSVPILRSE